MLTANSNARGTTLHETLAAIVVLFIAAAVLIPAADRSRRLSKVGEDLSHLRTIHGSTLAYAADFTDLTWQFSWRAQQVYWSPGDPAAIDLSVQLSDPAAARQQLTYLLRTIGGRTNVPNLVNLAFFPYHRFGHITLLQYLGLQPPTRMFVSPADERWRWANDPRGYDEGLYSPNLGTGGHNVVHPYGASYDQGTAFYDQAVLGQRVSMTASTATISVPSGHRSLHAHALSSVTHPSQKVFIHDRFARHFGPRQAYHMYPEARGPVLMCDGSACIKAFQEANPGANPNTPAAPAPTLTYQPSAIDPPASGPNVGPVLPGPLWTRMGIQGRDFGGPEVFP